MRAMPPGRVGEIQDHLTFDNPLGWRCDLAVIYDHS